MNTNKATMTRTARRSIGAASAAAALGLVLTACGGQTGQPTEAETTTVTSVQTSPAASPSASVQGDDNPLAEDVAGTPDQVYAAIDTAVAAVPGAKAYKYDFDGTKHEVQVTDGKKEAQVTVSTDGTKAEKTGTDGIGNIADDREDIVASKIDMKQAVQAALTQVPGVPDAVELNRDHELGADKLGWHVHVVDAQDDEHKVIVDAVTGKVAKVDVDH